MRKFIKDILTGEDNQTYDIGRVIAFVGGIAFIVIGLRMGMLVATAQHPFDFQAFGIGFGSMAGGIGVLMHLKREPAPVQNKAE